MPNRSIKESCRTSPTLALISAEAERLFWRLVTVADDYGRFDADPMVLRATCFSRMLDHVKTAQVSKWFEELVSVELVIAYTADGRNYGQFKTWQKHQRIRAEKSKFPSLTSADIRGHPLTAAAVNDDRSRVRSTSTSTGPRPRAPADARGGCSDCESVLKPLRELTGRNFQSSNGSGLHSRHQEHGVPACVQVVRVVGKRLLANPKTRVYARPKTLFGPENFAEYLAEAGPAGEIHDPSLSRVDDEIARTKQELADLEGK